MDNLDKLWRIVDVNQNRLSEGLRILEEIARLYLEDETLILRLKNLRHSLTLQDITSNSRLLFSRQADTDIGAQLETADQSKPETLFSLVSANAKRAEQSLRVLEEFAGLPETGLDASLYSRGRFELYTLEKDLAARLLRKNRRDMITGLYVAIDADYLAGRDIPAVTREALEGGCRLIQLRAKTASTRKFLALALSLKEICLEYGALFIVNDRLDIALACGADGLHLGQTDMPLSQARRFLPPDSIIGISADTPEQAVSAQNEGADYVAAGAVFPTQTKPDVLFGGLSGLKAIHQVVKIPLVAIGGINKSNFYEAMQAGADSLCLISAVLGAPDIKKATSEFITLMEAAKID
ncbi:thiamine-phosphate pyrophosphorylase [Dehalococcoides mccartyi]|uniref:Thiamine-phosphate synthase n=1 Tax=Dehalococcoides mccartyi TaxID=61435 RepID=A0A0V8LY05_9CHLR|nr:thiamine phosphate synthase [Dehalococcoides mccartyi]KSV16415.1 thiamine-phosphate pyrophosphorylase [Dehalococcoides mccartyi]